MLMSNLYFDLLGQSCEEFCLRHGKTGNKKSATCFATLLQNELDSDVARFTTHIKPALQQIRLLIGLNMRGKRRNIAIQRVLQQCQLQCCKTSYTFFLVRFTVPLSTSLRRFRRETSVSTRKKYRLEPGVVNSLPLRENSRERFVLKPKFSGDLFFYQ